MRKDTGKSDQKKKSPKYIKTAKGGNFHLADYSVYHFSKKERLTICLQYLVLDGCISYLFFDSWIVFGFFLPGMVLFFKEKRQELQKKEKQKMLQQFLDAIQLMSASLQVGYSAENALRESVRELKKMYEGDTFILREMEWMVSQTEMGRNLEELFMDFGRRSQVEDIKSFAEIFLTAKRSGGDLLLIIRNTTSCIRQKQETLQEIETTLSGKIMEQNIMSVIPLGILAYVRLASPEFLEGMYGNALGSTVMTICFLVYAAAYFWGRKIVQIEV